MIHVFVLTSIRQETMGIFFSKQQQQQTIKLIAHSFYCLAFDGADKIAIFIAIFVFFFLIKFSSFNQDNKIKFKGEEGCAKILEMFQSRIIKF